MIVSLIFGAIGIIQWQKGNTLISSGKKATAIVDKNVYSRDGDSGTYYPVVRFLTDEKEWITQQLDVGYSPAMPEGTRIDVIYDPEEPENVQINSTFYLEILPRILVALAICGFIFGILEVFDVISLID
jgi:hypothetical protein